MASSSNVVIFQARHRDPSVASSRYTTSSTFSSPAYSSGMESGSSSPGSSTTDLPRQKTYRAGHSVNGHITVTERPGPRGTVSVINGGQDVPDSSAPTPSYKANSRY